MDLLRQWRARLLGGAAAAITVPVAIVAAALAVGAAGGGIGGLGALGQALTGPGVPEVEPAANRGATAADDAGEMLPDAMAAAPSPAAGRTPATRGGSRRTGRADEGGGAGGGTGNRPRRPSSARPPGAARPTPSQAPQPTPEPTKPPSTVRQVGDAAKGVTNQVPIAGGPAGEVVDLIVETAEQLPVP